MTIEQRKIALINWITELDDEGLIRFMEELQNSKLNDLPSEIVELLSASDSVSDSELLEHIDSRMLLRRK